MKKLYRLISLLFVLCLLFTAAVSSLAAGYTYTLTIRSGEQGTMTGTGVTVNGVAASGTLSDDNTVLTITGLTYGDRIIIEKDSCVSLNNDKYYIKGLRVSGQNSDDAVQALNLRIEGDMDFVVAYGIGGEMAKYTVRYLDADGNQLAADREGYAKVGEKVSVPAQYFDGYLPQAYNLNKTIVSDVSENIFAFTYTRVTSASAANTAQTTGNSNNSTTAAPNANIDSAAVATDSPSAEITVNQETNTEPDSQSQTELDEPREWVDLDDQNLPLADSENENTDTEDGQVDNEASIMSNTMKVILCVLCVILVAGLTVMYIIVIRKQKK